MQIADLMQTGLELLALGMGTVFAFLLLLVWLVMGLSKLTARFAPAAPVASPTAAPVPAADAELTAVISAAVTRYRAEHSAA
ncbi:MAG: OadG family protein [Chromatiales bacterium]|nr:OadG family protein [Chromatiales bacterium]